MKVKFLPQDIELEIESGQSVMEVAHKNGIFIKSVCNGVPSGAECRVKLVEGEQNVMSPSNKELGLIGTGYFIDQRRLSCQLKCFGDVAVDLSEQIEKQKTAPKKVLGNRKMDLEKSHAVSAMLIEQEVDLRADVEKAVERAAEQRHRHGHRHRDGRGSSGGNAGGAGTQALAAKPSEGRGENRGGDGRRRRRGGRNRKRR